MIILRQKYFGKISDKIQGKIQQRLHEKFEESAPKDKELYEKILKDNHKEAGVDKIGVTKNHNAYKGDGLIVLSKDTVDQGRFGTLAHEMGHAYHTNNKKSKLGRAIHNLSAKIDEEYVISAIGPVRNKRKIDPDYAKESLTDQLRRVADKNRRFVGSTASGLSGVAAGYKAEEEKEKGNKKKARLISAGSLAVPVLGHTPELGREISASSKAMKMIKKAGANKQQIRGARKSLGYALGTYGVGLGKNLIINSGGQLVGKGAYKLTHKKKKEDKE